MTVVYLQHSPLLTASYIFHALYFHKPGYPSASNAACSAISSILSEILSKRLIFLVAALRSWIERGRKGGWEKIAITIIYGSKIRDSGNYFIRQVRNYQERQPVRLESTYLS